MNNSSTFASKISVSLQKMQTFDWIALALWTITLMLMIAFIGVAAGMSKTDKEAYANAMGAVGLVFALFLSGSIMFTVINKYIAKNRR